MTDNEIKKEIDETTKEDMEVEDIEIEDKDLDMEEETDKKMKTTKPKISEESKKIRKLEKELLKVKEKEVEYLNGLHRAMAEFDNFKKRTQKEKEALYKEAVSDVISKFLPVIDSIDSALKASTDEKVNDGLMLVSKKIAEVLLQMEVTEIPSEGEEFDPNLHHAIMHVEDDKIDENTVIEVFQKGYQYKGKVIRVSMVKVAN